MIERRGSLYASAIIGVDPGIETHLAAGIVEYVCAALCRTPAQKILMCFRFQLHLSKRFLSDQIWGPATNDLAGLGDSSGEGDFEGLFAQVVSGIEWCCFREEALLEFLDFQPLERVEYVRLVRALLEAALEETDVEGPVDFQVQSQSLLDNIKEPFLSPPPSAPPA
eukprot:GABV01008594.1.p1 GENE.GABV01008594.1~~GABV01008594.1.p1  ORF type:complete len:167 (-),score=44.50 GABV01008594.1:263-763(-)